MLILPDNLEKNNKYKYKVFLCSYKKYIKKQKNGILMININDEIIKMIIMIIINLKFIIIFIIQIS